MGEDFKAELARYKVKTHYSEPEHQHQNHDAEGRVRDAKELTSKLISVHNAPEIVIVMQWSWQK